MERLEQHFVEWDGHISEHTNIKFPSIVNIIKDMLAKLNGPLAGRNRNMDKKLEYIYVEWVEIGIVRHHYWGWKELKRVLNRDETRQMWTEEDGVITRIEIWTTKN